MEDRTAALCKVGAVQAFALREAQDRVERSLGTDFAIQESDTDQIDGVEIV